jgi:sugar (pentulose or hexulose) kinase
VLIWASTFWLQVPQHLRLSEPYDSYAQQLLVQTNWIRTLAWTARGFLLAWALHQQLD